MRCPSCGNKLSKADASCPSCGTPVGSKSAYFGGAARSVRTAWGLPVSIEGDARAKGRVSGYLVFAIVALLLVAGMLVALFLLQNSASPSRGTALDASTFPDPVLRAAAAAYDLDGDGHLSENESSACRELDLSETGLADLSGVRTLRSLERLDVSGNDLAEADLTGLVRLRDLDLSRNALTSFSTAGLPSLLRLDVSGNGLASLDVGPSDRLVSLHCTGNSIARLDLAGGYEIMELDCDPGQNTVVPLSPGFFPDESLRTALADFDTDRDGALSQRERQSVTTIRANDSTLSDLYGLTWFDALGLLDVSDCRLTFLDGSLLSQSVTAIDASGCPIKEVDLSGCAHLVALDLSGSPLASIDLSNNQHLSTLDLSGCKLAGELDLSGLGGLAQLDVSGNPKLSSVTVASASLLNQPGAIVADEGCAVTAA